MDRIRPYLKRGEASSSPAGGLVQNLLGMLGFDPKMYAAFEIWDRETRGLIRGCEAVGIQNSILYVSVPSAIHRQELLYSKKRILDRVNQALGGNVIKDIQFELKGKQEPVAPSSRSTIKNYDGTYRPNNQDRNGTANKGGNLSEQSKIRLGVGRHGKSSE